MLAGQFRVAEGDAPVAFAYRLARRRRAVTAEIKPGLRRDIGMSPAVQDDGGDIALGVKPGHAEQFLHLFAHLDFNIPVTVGEQLVAAHNGLRLQRQALAEIRNVECQHRRFGRVQGVCFAVDQHLFAQVRVPAEAAEPLGRGNAQAFHELPVAHGHVDRQDGRVVELLVGLFVGFGQITQYVLVDPAAAGHDHAPCPDPVEFAAPVVNHVHKVGVVRFAVVFNVHGSGVKPDSNGLPGPVERLPIHVAP